ncbi:hypothetical protein QF032_000233 [Streptomyces achromogenes]|uniref:Lipoprotein n=1 Tax=Streptomyces achromogenes TaxID=67255 RepID=A0ABU0PSY4_STRAH|nr:hypothetical protein [Streptomyces achromogenes]MDQ0681241.1 hypothetical protein [Streptomyces achromogenes]MDQ0828389.1 hypothetical protein [Streptomyces achromogenes]
MESTRRRATRRTLIAVAACVAMTGVSGCTVPIDAVAGISVTDDGRLLGVLMVCGHRIDGATLYVDDADADDTTTVGSWTADRPLLAGLATWPLEPPTVGWTATTPLAPLTVRTTYALYGWTEDDSWSSTHVTFTLTDRDRLTPGKVLYQSISDDGEESTTTVSLTEFKREACRHD